VIPGYDILQILCNDERYRLFRGRRRQDAQPALIKTPRHDAVRLAERLALEREFQILLQLPISGVAQPLEWICNDRGCALIMEDRGGVPLSEWITTRRKDLPGFFHIAIQLATVLAELHRRDLILNHLSPRGVLVNPADAAVELIDFGLALQVNGEHYAPVSPSILPGILAYLSPEQTGRMNRTTDYRSDFYALGVTLYELLTGTCPFADDDTLELIHRQLARLPPPPAEIDPRLPEAVSRIIMKLLAKTAEGRYQSAVGLRKDLEICAAGWADSGSIAVFPLGRHDVSERFLIPQKLYGRDWELATLLKAFDESCAGSPTLMLVAGYPGIGKTALIQELYKPIVRERGYFIAGKFDQIVQTPYSALLQAFRHLVQQLLTEGEDSINGWRERLAVALGGNAAVLAEVIPEIALLLGPQPLPPELPPAETQNRFRLVLQNFLAVFARPTHPLVIFLDDLQWADAATLNLLQPVFSSPAIRHLLLIGAYRDNEIDAGHPLTRTLAALEAEGTEPRRIVLGPLGFPELLLLISDTLHGGPADGEPLARLVLQKTGANPFFVIQFLKTLWQEGLLILDYTQGGWTFDIQAIGAARMTDNVVELMTRKIQRLTADSQQMLTLAACIGNEFDLHTLAIVSRQSPSETAARLSDVLHEGLVSPAPRPYNAPPAVADAASPYAFLHDRVQQAAYALIPEDRKRGVHLAIGRLLLERREPAATEGGLFDIVHHLNRGWELISDPDERLTLAELNLNAARKAKTSTAYQAALGYLEAGIQVLSETHWHSRYELLFALHLDAGECEYLCGRFTAAERRFGLLLERARTRMDKAQVYNRRLIQYENMSRYQEAIEIGREALALFGVVFPTAEGDKEAAFQAELNAIRALLGERPIASLLDLPTLRDPEIRLIMQLLGNLHTPCYLAGDKRLTLLNTETMVRLSLGHGNTEQSAHAYVLHAMLLGPILGEYQAAYEFGTLALRLNERLADAGSRARILMNFSWAVSIWRRPMEESIPLTREAFRLGHETGLVADAGYALFNETYFTLLCARELDAVQPVCTANVEFLKRAKMDNFVDAPRVIRQWGRALQGLTEAPDALNDGDFRENDYQQAHAGHTLFLMFYFCAKLALLYTFGSYASAAAAAEQAAAAIRDYPGTIWDALRVYYHALTLTALHGQASVAERRGIETDLDALNARLRHWADNSPANFLAQHLIVSAEIARVHRRDQDAIRWYEAAGEAAGAQSCRRERALAHELYGRYWRERGLKQIAVSCLRAARQDYAEWGASAKVHDLESKHPELLQRQPSSWAPFDTGQGNSTLDLFTVLKAAQAISGEIELDKLLEKLLHSALENAGAERGCLMLERAGAGFVHAQGSVDTVNVRIDGVPLADVQSDLPTSLINYVRRTAAGLVLANARSDDRFAGDPYLARHPVLSVLCTPVLKQGRLIGVLYLENQLCSDAFTPERIDLMQILASQAAISLENAGLFEDRKRTEEALRAALNEVEQLKNRLQAENVYLQEEILAQHNFQEIIGNSPSLLTMLRHIEHVAGTDATVLILGETGTGKELIARAIHDRSRRRNRPLVKVNCAAISTGLVESELFGHVKGAFTGAIEKRIGRFELAHSGTLFLDEIGELPLETQAKLLRVLQEQEFEPVGSNRTLKVDVRVIAATNRDLEQAVAAGRFRADLFYRLHVFPLAVPPLRERRQDIPALALFFLERYAKHCGKRITGVAQQAMERLVRYDWPGNIRELQNTIERAVIICRGPVLDMDNDRLIAAESGERNSAWADPAAAAPANPQPTAGVVAAGSGRTATMTLEETERRHILAVLEQTRGVIEGARGAARILAMKPSTLRSRMKKLGIL
jgi:Nif-specific regulatory protein